MGKQVSKDDVKKDAQNVAAFLRALDQAIPGHVPADLLGLLDGAGKYEPIADLLVLALAGQPHQEGRR